MLALLLLPLLLLVLLLLVLLLVPLLLLVLLLLVLLLVPLLLVPLLLAVLVPLLLVPLLLLPLLLAVLAMLCSSVPVTSMLLGAMQSLKHRAPDHRIEGGVTPAVVGTPRPATLSLVCIGNAMPFCCRPMATTVISRLTCN
jgi:hypothetical protein